MRRLMVKLGVSQEQSKALVASSTPKPTAAATSLNGQPAVKLEEGFDRAWRRVGLALDRTGFTVEDRDRKQGLFFLRYADPEKAGQDEPNFFQRLFGAKASAPVRYRVSVKADGVKSTVRILNDGGQPVTDDNAKRILSLLMDDLK